MQVYVHALTHTSYNMGSTQYCSIKDWKTKTDSKLTQNPKSYIAII